MFKRMYYSFKLWLWYQDNMIPHDKVQALMYGQGQFYIRLHPCRFEYVNAIIELEDWAYQLKLSRRGIKGDLSALFRG